jgi:hypothetical protein
VTHRPSERNWTAISSRKNRDLTRSTTFNAKGTPPQFHTVLAQFLRHNIGLRNPLAAPRRLCRRLASRIFGVRIGALSGRSSRCLSRLRAPETLAASPPRCGKYTVVASWSPRGQAPVMFARYSVTRRRLSEPWPESEIAACETRRPSLRVSFLTKIMVTKRARQRPRKRGSLSAYACESERTPQGVRDAI